jgi:hypothetical protein
VRGRFLTNCAPLMVGFSNLGRFWAGIRLIITPADLGEAGETLRR